MLRSQVLRLARTRAGVPLPRPHSRRLFSGFTNTAASPSTAASFPWVSSRRFESSSASPEGNVDGNLPTGPDINVNAGSTATTVTYEQVWSLWNEGNLFSLQVAQMRDFLSNVGIATDLAAKKAAVVRRLEEYLQSKDTQSTAGAAATAGVAGAETAAAGTGGLGGEKYGNWAASGATQPEAMLDLAQAGFYQGTATMVPRAFQMLTSGSSAEAVVSRVNTAAFPGFPANTECYTLSASDAEGALQARYSKVLQWCLLNMNNLRMDGELSVEVGKLLLAPAAMRHNERVVSAYTLQQRLQLTRPFTWVATVPDSAVSVVENFLAEKGYHLVSKNAQLTYQGTIKRANDKLDVTLSEHMKVEGVYGDWIDVQTAFCTAIGKPDLRVLLRSRPPVTGQDRDIYSKTPVIEVVDDDVSDVLPPELGQLVYLSENETRHFERLNDKGIAIAVWEVKRQPLIVLRDDEEDPRIEYRISVDIPASAGSHSMDVRAVGLEVLALGEELSAAIQQPFNEAYGLAPAMAQG